MHYFLAAFILSTLNLSASPPMDPLDLAFELANRSREHGSHPFGAVLVYRNEVFLSAENHVIPEENPLKHAEIVLLERYLDYKQGDAEKRRRMAPHLNGKLPPIEECQMYTSTEPCQMCEGAIHTMKLGRYLAPEPQVVFGLDKDSLSECVRGHRKHSRKVLKSGPHKLDAAKKPHQNFWPLTTAEKVGSP